MIAKERGAPHQSFPGFRINWESTKEFPGQGKMYFGERNHALDPLQYRAFGFGSWLETTVPIMDQKTRERKYNEVKDIAATIWNGLFKDRTYPNYPDYFFILENSNQQDRKPKYGMYLTNTKESMDIREPYDYVAYARNGQLVRIESRIGDSLGEGASIQITPITSDNILCVAPSLLSDEGVLIDRFVVSFWNAREYLDDIHKYVKEGEDIFALPERARGDIPFAFRNPQDISGLRIA